MQKEKAKNYFKSVMLLEKLSRIRSKQQIYSEACHSWRKKKLKKRKKRKKQPMNHNALGRAAKPKPAKTKHTNQHPAPQRVQPDKNQTPAHHFLPAAAQRFHKCHALQAATSKSFPKAARRPLQAFTGGKPQSESPVLSPSGSWPRKVGGIKHNSRYQRAKYYSVKEQVGQIQLLLFNVTMVW